MMNFAAKLFTDILKSAHHMIIKELQIQKRLINIKEIKEILIKAEVIFPLQYLDIVYRALKKFGVDNIFITKGESRGFFNPTRRMTQRGTKIFQPELSPTTKMEIIIKEKDVPQITAEIAHITKMSSHGGAKGGKILIQRIETIEDLNKIELR